MIGKIISRIIDIIPKRALHVGDKLYDKVSHDSYIIMSIQGSWVGVMNEKRKSIVYLPTYQVYKRFST